MPDPAGSSPSGHRAVREIALFGAAGGALLAVLKLTEYRFLVLHHSAEIYTALAAALFAAVGIWLGVTLRRRGPEVIVKEVQVDGPFRRDDQRVRALGLTPRETEIRELIAAGLSNREIADRLCVSENTVKDPLRPGVRQARSAPSHGGGAHRPGRPAHPMSRPKA